MDEPTMNSSVLANIGEPCFLAAVELRAAPPEQVVFRDPSEFRIVLRNGFEQLIVDHRLPGFLGALLRNPSPFLEQLADLLSGIRVQPGQLLLDTGEQFGAAGFPTVAQPQGRLPVERDAVRGDPITDRGDTMLELERPAAISIRLQELP